MIGFLGVVLSSVLFLFYLYRKYINRNTNYWKIRGVTPLDNDLSLFQLLSARKSPPDYDKEYYQKLGDEKYGGAFEFGTPMLVVKDVDMVKQVLVKDFEYFMDHRPFVETDPLFSNSLFYLHTGEWKDMRGFLSPTFTSGKLRRMFHNFEQSSQQMHQFIRDHSKKSGNGFDVHVQDIFGRFTTDVIFAIAFGIQTDALSNKNSELFNMVDRSAHMDQLRLFKSGLFTYFSKVGNFFKMNYMAPEITDFFVQLLGQAVTEREANRNTGRDDFLELLVNAKRENKTGLDFDLNLAVQQGYLFFMAGFDTAANLMGQAAYLLAVRPDIQEKLLKEVTNSLVDGKLSYDDLKKLDYLDMFLSEILRMYPHVDRIERMCTQNYRLPDADFVVPKGMVLTVPAECIHYDEKYYTDPHTFYPERFSAEEKANRNTYSYLPFGTGPRTCLGSRFALTESKLVVAYLVKEFEIKPTEGLTPVPVRMTKVFGVNRHPKTLHVKLIPRK